MRGTENPKMLARYQPTPPKRGYGVNGSITVSKTAGQGSNPCIHAKKKSFKAYTSNVGRLSDILQLLRCSSEAEQGAVNSKVGDFEIPHHSRFGFYTFKLTR